MALLKNKLPKLKLELSPNRIYADLVFFVCEHLVPKSCQLCLRFYVSCQKFDKYLRLQFANMCLSNGKMSDSILDLLPADGLKQFPWICIIHRIIFLTLSDQGLFNKPQPGGWGGGDRIIPPISKLIHLS